MTDQHQPWLSLYDLYYPAGTEARHILEHHCRQVADLALEVASLHAPYLDPTQVETAAMLHDIGIFLTDAPGIHCYGTEPYLRHGILGADLLRKEGFPEWCARVAERHTGAGITADDIIKLNLPLPTDRVMMPQTDLEQVVCYADKFYSKSGDMKRKSLDRVRNSMLRHSPETLERFNALHSRWAISEGNI